MIGKYGLALLIFLTGCAIAQPSSTNISPPAGWLTVNLTSVENDVLLEDEVIGGLLENGLLTEKSVWYKPVYGNQNMIWTLSTDVGKRQVTKLLDSQEAFLDSGYIFENNELRILQKTWRYAGYQIKPLQKQSLSFHAYYLYCTGASVVYWGETVKPLESTELLKLLEQLAYSCE